MKVLIIFGSLLGKTKRISILIGHLLKQSGLSVTVKAVQNTTVDELKEYQIVILGCSTWDDGMLQYDFRAFNDELCKKKMSKTQFAVFGLGGHKYPHFCASVDILESTVKRVNGTLLCESMRLDIDHDEAPDKHDQMVLDWVNIIITSLGKR